MPIESSPCETEGSSINRLRWTRGREQPGIALLGALRRRGLRWKFNAALLPVVAVTIALLVWLDYRHERQAVMAAHALHVTAVAAGGAAAGPVDPATSPEAVARRSLAIHAVHAASLLVLVALSLNAVLSRFVLKPIDIVRDGIEKMERGHWRTPVQSARQDEMGRVVESFQMLGLRVDALVAQLLRAERLATLALVAKKTAAEISPRVERIGAAVGHLQRLPDGPARDAAREIATASAEILRVVRGLDRLFEANLHATAWRQGLERTGRDPCADERVQAAPTKPPVKCGTGVQ